MALVHNGVIENFRPIKERLLEKGYEFRSATDSEVAAHLIADELAMPPTSFDDAADPYVPLIAAVQAALSCNFAAPMAWRSSSAIGPT